MRELQKSESNASFRRVYFVAVDHLFLLDRLSASDMQIGSGGSFTVKITKNGGAVATPSGSTITEVDATNFKGLFYLTLAQADLDTAGPLLIRIVSTGGAKTMEQREIEVDVVEFDKHNAQRGTVGTALPNVAAGGAGGIFVRGTGTGAINQDADGRIDVRVVAGDFLTTLARISGLLHENSMIDNVVYGDNNVITSARERVFASAAACNAATPGAGNGADGEIYRNTITAVDEGSGQISSFKKVRAL